MVIGSVTVFSMDPTYKSAKAVNTANVSTLTTYELRQELELRGAMDLADGTINHKSLLQRLVQELVKFETQAASQKVETDAIKVRETFDAEKKLREQRKAEALERSRLRQADPDYFSKRTEMNKEGKETLDSKKSEPVTPIGENDESEENDDEDDTDPFRTAKKSRSKIFVK